MCKKQYKSRNIKLDKHKLKYKVVVISLVSPSGKHSRLLRNSLSTFLIHFAELHQWCSVLHSILLVSHQVSLQERQDLKLLRIEKFPRIVAGNEVQHQSTCRVFPTGYVDAVSKNVATPFPTKTLVRNNDKMRWRRWHIVQLQISLLYVKSHVQFMHTKRVLEFIYIYRVQEKKVPLIFLL